MDAGKVKGNLRRIAYEDVYTAFLNGYLQVYGSEIATLRILKHFRGLDVNHGHHPYLCTWYLTMRLSKTNSHALESAVEHPL